MAKKKNAAKPNALKTQNRSAKKQPTTPKRLKTLERFDWQGITVSVAYEADWLGISKELPQFATAHLEIRSEEHSNAALPVTETGYRSHFIARALSSRQAGRWPTRVHGSMMLRKRLRGSGGRKHRANSAYSDRKSRWLNHDRHVPCLLRRGRLDADLHVLAQDCQEFHQTANRDRYGAATHQRRNLRLRCAQQFAGFALRQPALLDQFVNLHGQLRLQHLLLGIRQAEIGEDISAAFFMIFFHV
jgi:hypothetical protein